MEPYTRLEFPQPPLNRPYCFINMVTTIDGKILSGGREDDVLDLGSKADHTLMKRIEHAADGILVGAQTLRASPKSWLPAPRFRLVASKSGTLPFDARFFESDRAFVASSESDNLSLPEGIRPLQAGIDEIDWKLLFAKLRQEWEICNLLVSGGSELNAQLLKADLVDELFITIAPKVKLGRDVPTYAGGEPLGRDALQPYHLIEHHAIGDEIFIRYRRSTVGAS